MRTSLWLLPAPEEADALDAAVARIAGELSRATFPAHVTLATGPLSHVSARLSRLGERHAPFSLEPHGLMQMDDFIRAFAIRFTASPSLLALRAEAAASVCERSASAYEPHLSLTYGVTEPTQLMHEALVRFTHPIRFDRIVAVTVPPKNAEQSDVVSWKIWPAIKLSGNAEAAR